MQLTIGPLHEKLGSAVVVDTSFSKGEEDQMVEAALKSRGNVLICWAHEALPHIAAKILGRTEDVPSIWPENRYDLVWVFDQRPSLAGWTFQQVPQLLLSGDSTESLA